ncbi:MAG: hypothetical protein K2L28_05555 [Muribaculaceae bacterium]|nr:hypothetical protein [Muribaculaceae bacterium]
MEKNTPTPEQVDGGEDIIAKARANRKTITAVLIAAAVIIIAVLAWLMIAQAGSKKADELVAKADIEQNDSIASTLYAEAAKAGYKSGHRAAAMVAINLYRQGKYEETIKYLDNADLDDEIGAAGVYSLKGDCYVNLDKFDDAISCYKKAIGKADKNPEIVPFVLIKEANVYAAQQKYADEAKCYKTIIDEYPGYVRSSRVDINKYYERAAARAQKK